MDDRNLKIMIAFIKISVFFWGGGGGRGWGRAYYEAEEIFCHMKKIRDSAAQIKRTKRKPQYVKIEKLQCICYLELLLYFVLYNYIVHHAL
jgi:hypothetical protein